VREEVDRYRSSQDQPELVDHTSHASDDQENDRLVVEALVLRRSKSPKEPRGCVLFIG